MSWSTAAHRDGPLTGERRSSGRLFVFDGFRDHLTPTDMVAEPTKKAPHRTPFFFGFGPMPTGFPAPAQAPIFSAAGA